MSDMKKTEERENTACATPPNIPNGPLLRCKEVLALTKLSRATLYAKLAPSDPSSDKTFPVPIRVGARSVRWLASEIDAWIASRPRIREIKGAAK